MNRIEAKAQVDEAYDRVVEAERALSKTIVECYPVGSVVWYSIGNHEIDAEITGHMCARVRVRGLRTGKQYWINASRICP